MCSDAVEVADSVTIGVGKTARIDLVEDGLLPPFARHLVFDLIGYVSAQLRGTRAHHLGEVAAVETQLRIFSDPER
jgi:hypothetical protein